MALIDFIIKAKLSGYASGGEGQEKKFDDGSLGFEMASDGYRYLDRYNGFNPFAGSEHIYDSNNALIWVMNYYGEVLPGRFEPKSIYLFLKEAMLLITSEYPFRGPAELEKHNFRYENTQNEGQEKTWGSDLNIQQAEKSLLNVETLLVAVLRLTRRPVMR